jgi:hypothetical protein
MVLPLRLLKPDRCSKSLRLKLIKAKQNMKNPKITERVIYNMTTEKELNKLADSNPYKKADFDSRQSAFMNFPVDYRGKKIKLKKLYDEYLGYSERTVICGMCNRKGIIRKKGEYYEVHHGRVKRKKNLLHGKKSFRRTYIGAIKDHQQRILNVN